MDSLKLRYATLISSLWQPDKSAVKNMKTSKIFFMLLQRDFHPIYFVLDGIVGNFFWFDDVLWFLDFAGTGEGGDIRSGSI